MTWQTTSVRPYLKAKHIPGEFWFLRLRIGAGTMPVEHPGHRPPMVAEASGAQPAPRKRWDVWAGAGIF